MNLAKSFNKNYLLQNFKKSKALLAVILILIPIITLVMMIAFVTNYNNNYIITMSDISWLSIAAMYIVPVILSICLFGFVFKKTSVDFALSMPISKGSIFITNTIGGILLLIALNVMNVLIICIFNLMFSNIFIPAGLIVDYFVMWSVAYIFVFSAANLAMAISGNSITQIIVTALLLLLMPFMYLHLNGNLTGSSNISAQITCTEDACRPKEYYCYNDEECTLNQSLNIYNSYVSKRLPNNYTLPFSLIASGLFNLGYDADIYNSLSIFKMGILSIVFIIFGYFLFKRRKPEECETSFKSIHKHTIIKLLTMYPILAILFQEEVMSLDSIMYLIIIVIILAYFFIYDLITKRGIRELITSMIYLTGFVFLMIGISITINSVKKNTIVKFDVSDIKEIRISNEGYGNEYVNIDEKLASSDKDLINKIIKSTLENSYSYKGEIYYSEFILKLDNGKEVLIQSWVDESDLDDLYKAFNKDNQLINSYKDFSFDKVYALNISDKYLSAPKYQDIVNLVKKEVQSATLEDITATYNPSAISIDLYVYENHKVKSMTVNVKKSDELSNYIAKIHNELLKEGLKKNNNHWDYIERALYSDNRNMIMEEYRYLLEKDITNFKNFILREADKSFDVTKEYVIISFYYNNGFIKLYTNSVEEFDLIIKNARDKYKLDLEYKRILDLYNDDGTVKGWESK